MKLLAIIGVLYFTSVLGSEIPPPDSLYKPGDRYAYISSAAGEPQLVDLFEPVDWEMVQRNNDVHYHLFTRANRHVSQVLVQNNAASVHNSNFNANRETKFVIHGWNGHEDILFNALVVQAFLDNVDANVVVVDWNSLASANYVTAAWGTPGIGAQIGQFIRFLQSFGVPLFRLHLVGFSLGAHAAGIASRGLGGAVMRVTGLDPAGPLWIDGLFGQRLRATDAQYVEALHTNGGMAGIMDPVANADFYPNGGRFQPGCILPSCSHSRAYALLAESFYHSNFVARGCANLDQVSSGTCTGNTAVMGGVNLSKFVNGIFHFTTRGSSPFAL